MAYIHSKEFPEFLDVSESTGVGPGTYNPILFVGVHSLFFTLFRVKTVNIHFEGSFLPTGSSTREDFNIDVDSDWCGTYGDYATSEEDLLINLEHDLDISAGSHVGGLSYCGTHNNYRSGSNDATALFYPYFYLFFITLPISTLALPGYVPWTNMTLFTSTAQLYVNPDNDVDLLYSEITAKEYWPYDPGDTDPYPGKDGSGPVYNSSTGAQLRNPSNIVKRGDGTFYNPNA